jgi:hypothetical protein
LKIARELSPTRRTKTGSVLSQIDVLDMSGRARSGRRLRRGPEPSRGGGTRGRIMRSGDGAGVAVEACRRGKGRCGCCVLARNGGGVKKRRIGDWRMLVGRDGVEEQEEEEEVNMLEPVRREEVALLRIVGGQRGML